MRVQGFTTGVFQSNCYLIVDPDGSDAVVVDPGQDAAEPLRSAAEAAGASVRAILLTHGHVDHVWSAAEAARVFDVPCYLHPADRYMLEDPGAAIGVSGGASSWEIEIPEALEDLHDQDRFSYGGLSFEARHAPGHTPGHCIFLTDGLVVSGDLIFAGSVGRTDFPGGSGADLLDSIRRLVLPLDDETAIISGHGPATTVGQERASNPFLVPESSATARRLLGL